MFVFSRRICSLQNFSFYFFYQRYFFRYLFCFLWLFKLIRRYFTNKTIQKQNLTIKSQMFFMWYTTTQKWPPVIPTSICVDLGMFVTCINKYNCTWTYLYIYLRRIIYPSFYPDVPSIEWYNPLNQEICSLSFNCYLWRFHQLKLFIFGMYNVKEFL